MIRTSNLRIKGITPVISPSDLKQVFPLSEQNAKDIARHREEIKQILDHKSPRLMVVVGPCSIHDPLAAIEYAERLAALKEELSDQLLLVMRVYFEKPRTTIGWKGLINDPDLNGTHQISKGLGVARRLLCAITDLGLPIAGEMLDPVTPHYLADLISWGAIGARTTESQTHREMASGLSFPVGFKNGTDGGLQVAIDAIGAALHSHSFLGINNDGMTSIVSTEGNSDVHIVLRGGNDGPNYAPVYIEATKELLASKDLKPTIMVDCSHANSNKDHRKQGEVLDNVLEQIAGGETAISSLMIESNLEEGNQPISDNPEQLRYGVSITDKCVSWDETEAMLRRAHARLKELGGRKSA